MRQKMILLGALLLLLLAACSNNSDTSTTSPEESSAESEKATEQQDELVIYLVRHGKTWFNTTGQVQGFADSQLTDDGKEQASIVGKGLSDMEFVSAYSSELGRQRNTAKLILAENNHAVPEIIEHDGFKEWNYGGFEGKTNEEMWNPVMNSYDLEFDEEWSDYAELVEILGDDGIADAIAEHDPLGAAETYDEITTRGKEAMNLVVENNQAGNVLIVSSGSMIPTLLEILVPGEYQGESIDNGSVTILKYKDGEYTLDVLGDTSYLKED